LKFYNQQSYVRGRQPITNLLIELTQPY